ncbi:MAG: hypothetical protein Q8O24_03495 [Gallionellaceae bacterium]|nr:hypothetical protein [Gallionellaceae bacterium]
MRTLNLTRHSGEPTRHTGVGRYPALLLKGLLALTVLRTNYLTYWIPAYAGMTREKEVGSSPVKGRQ